MPKDVGAAAGGVGEPKGEVMTHGGDMTDINHVTVSRLAGDTLISLETGGGANSVQTFRLTRQAVDQLLRELTRSREISQIIEGGAQ